ncbi:MAG TPA: peroxidase [Deltaproteobacteria bacterium]|nr:peroxidase [Deltaproteobacteria bacterium]
MGGDYDLVMKIAHDYRNAGLDEKDAAMLEYAEQITLHPNQVSEKNIERLRQAGWSDRDILDIAAVTSYRNFITRMADALGVELTEDYKNLRKDYVESLMVGKQLL